MKLKVIVKEGWNTVIPVFAGGKISEASYQSLRAEWAEAMNSFQDFITGDREWNEANQY